MFTNSMLTIFTKTECSDKKKALLPATPTNEAKLNRLCELLAGLHTGFGDITIYMILDRIEEARKAELIGQILGNCEKQLLKHNNKHVPNTKEIASQDRRYIAMFNQQVQDVNRKLAAFKRHFNEMEDMLNQSTLISEEGRGAIKLCRDRLCTGSLSDILGQL